MSTEQLRRVVVVASYDVNLIKMRLRQLQILQKNANNTDVLLLSAHFGQVVHMKHFLAIK